MSASVEGVGSEPAAILRVHDVRQGGRWTGSQRVKNALIYGAARAAIAVLGRLPRRLLVALGRALGAAAVHGARGHCEIAQRNLECAFPELDAIARRALLAQSYRLLGEHLGDAVAVLSGAEVAPMDLAPTVRATLTAALASGKGCLFVSAHLGPWEHVASTLVASGFPLTTVARESYDPRFTALYDRLRGGAGVATIYRGQPGAGMRIVRTLRRGGLLGLLMDLRSRVPSIDVDFLGRPASTPVGPARLALRTGAAVVVGTVAPAAPGTERLHLTVTVIPTVDLPADQGGERLLTQRINDELSRRIRAFPEGWLWMHPRWESPCDAGPPTRAETR